VKNKQYKKRKYQPFSISEQVPYLLKLNKKEKLALFLGAGISSSCGLPDWSTLLECLKIRLEKKGHLLTENDDIANQARSTFGEKFNSIVADCLYFNGVNLSPSIVAIAKSGINKIACFNFDDLLEEVLSAECVKHKIILNGERFNINEKGITVFHPHGYLGRFDSEDEYSKSRIVLSNSDYESLYENHYCLTNLIQLSMLINYSVLFVGMSLTDPNTLRLLRKAREVGVNHWHYALFKSKDNESQRTKTRKLRNIGVDPIWFSHYTDIPKIFSRLTINREEGKDINIVNEAVCINDYPAKQSKC